MRVALVHDYIKEYGGAERVLEALHEIYPDAPVYTTVFLPKFLGPHRKRFEVGSEKWEVRTSFLQYLPFKEKLISPIRIIAPFVFRLFDFSEADIVIVSSTGAYSPNLINKKNAIQFCYCHTPPRYLYGFATAREWKKNIVFRILGETANHFLRIIDFNSSQNVDYFIANSHNVASRIEKFYRRESKVIYPPVGGAEVANENFSDPQTETVSHLNKDIVRNADSKNFISSPRHYYLAGGRLARPKHIDLIVRACRELDFPLKVFGKGFAGYDKEILRYKDTRILKPNIQFLGEVTDEEKIDLMRNAKAYIFAAVDEDFGITPVEAMSVGTPVIAYRSGGVLESVIDGKTGLFFNELTVESLSKAIKQLNNVTIDPKNCIMQAQKFSKDRFKKEIKEFINSKLKTINK
ncbi:glycosyltransferase [Patescibacteria group bacterium]|nr:glycosyltransferase [Patescibacteria group bacterium]